MKRKKKMWISMVAILIGLLVIIFGVLPPGRTEPLPFRDEYGNILAGSIAEKCTIEVNGSLQGMFLRGRDSTKPVLLLLHGGPGMPDYFLAQEYPANLEDLFVVCYWEQRGTGLSYAKGMDKTAMTTDQLIQDTLAVTDYLRDRFHQEKIYLMGHSWGTYLGIRTAAKSPERYHAYIAMSQVVDQPESELESYAYMLEKYREMGRDGMVRRLERFPVNKSKEALAEFSTSLLRDKAMHELGVGTTRDMDSVMTGIFLPSLKCRDYTIPERIRIWQGKAFSRSTGLLEEMNSFDARLDTPSLNLPVFFFAGIHDRTCSYQLQKEYYNRLKAPFKGFYTFDESAHSPVFEEPEMALRILAEEVL